MRPAGANGSNVKGVNRLFNLDHAPENKGVAMKHVLKISHRACWLAFALMGGAVLGWTPPLWAGETAPLNILLTNDDGVDAPGIRAVREALLAAGHKVTMVAPIEDHSGSGAQVTTRGSIGYQERSSGVWSVDGFPADAVLIGLLHIMKDEKADLVVAGANFGQNLGYAINSGTVGAATVAMYAGVPAIALSVGVDYAEVSAQPYPFPSTFKAFPGAAELCVRLIRNLQDARTGTASLLPDHTILNVNYPATGTDTHKGVRVLQAARSAGVLFDYEETGEPGQLAIGILPADPETALSDNTDWQLFSRGYVTVSVLDGDWDAGQSMRDKVRHSLTIASQEQDSPELGSE
jgi:5'/3'-nucleotidase SurE